MDDLIPYDFEFAVVQLWTAMRDRLITRDQYDRIKAATKAGASPATRFSAIYELLGTADRLPEGVRVALFDRISQGLALFQEAS